ncbi:MAG: GNAT family N-acetyltransferase [Dehalococcoidia bacterium]|jgi:ribosomal protein S18 acetylase RimI-like enzyme
MMSTDSANIIRLAKSQVERAGEVLSRAFRNDPMLVAYIPDAVKRQKRLRTMFRIELGHAVEHGEVYAVSPDFEGVAVWLPSTAPEMSLWTMLRGGGLKLLFTSSWGFLNRMKKDDDFASGRRRKLAPNPHWYLAVLGVDPDFQGRGCASRLLKPMLARLDREKIPAYLETDVEGYVAMYQHFGFKVIEEAVLPGSGSRMWVLLRKND